MGPSLLRCAVLLLMGLSWAGTARAADGNAAHLPRETRDLVKASFREIFLLPDQVHWEFDVVRPYPTTGTSVCGRVNYEDSTRHYVGFRLFFAVLVDGHVTDHRIVPDSYVADPTYTNLQGYKIACGAPPSSFTKPPPQS
jgi:hypothetical protein